MADHQSVKSEIARIAIPVIILVAGIGGFMALGGPKKAEQRKADEKGVPLVEADVVGAQRGLDIEVDGQVVPYREIALSAEVDGRIIEKAAFARAGKYVEKDAVLIRIDPKDYKLERDRLQTELDQAGVTIQELDEEIKGNDRLVQLAENQIQLQQREYERRRRLHERQVISKAELEVAEQNVISAQNSVTTVRNQLRLLETRRSRLKKAQASTALMLDKAAHDLERTTIRSPASGVVVRDMVESGSYVKEGMELLTIEDTTKVEVKCNLRMEELYWLWDQRRAEVAKAEPARTDYQIPEADASVIYQLGGKEYHWEGQLARFDGIGLEEATRTVPCRVSVDDPREVFVMGPAGEAQPASGPPALVRGMFVTLRIHAKPKTKLLAVPERAIRPGDSLWRVRKGRLHAVAVEVIELTGKTAAIRAEADELVPGDLVVVSPLAGDQENTRVRVKMVEPEMGNARRAQETPGK